MSYPPPPCPVEDRIAIADLIGAYARAVDTIGDIDGVAALFTDDAVYDLAALGAGQIRGRDGIADFFRTAFAGMAQNAHFIANIALLAHRGDEAVAEAHGHAFSLGKDGTLLDVKARYAFGLRRVDGVWRIERLGMTLLLPAVQTTAG